MRADGSRPNEGRPPKFKTPEKLLEAFKSWKIELAPGGSLQGEIPDVEGFCDYVNSYRQLFMEYEKKEEFSTTIKEIKNWIYYRKKQLAMTNKMNATVFIFDAKNNAGYVDKTEQDINHSGDVTFVNDLPRPKKNQQG